MRQVPVRSGRLYTERCAHAAAAVARAAAVLPDEWAFELWAGKLAAKAGAPLGTVLCRYRRSESSTPHDAKPKVSATQKQMLCI